MKRFRGRNPRALTSITDTGANAKDAHQQSFASESAESILDLIVERWCGETLLVRCFGGRAFLLEENEEESVSHSLTKQQHQ